MEVETMVTLLTSGAANHQTQAKPITEKVLPLFEQPGRPSTGYSQMFPMILCVQSCHSKWPGKNLSEMRWNNLILVGAPWSMEMRLEKAQQS